MQSDLTTEEYFVFHDAMLSFFEKSVASEALRYLKDRGISEEVRKTFRLGFCPDVLLCKRELDVWQLSAKVAEVSGFLSSRCGPLYSHFAHRITFPIFSVRGQTVGFGSRTLPGRILHKDGTNTFQYIPDLKITGAKYINSPETPIYKKSEHIFGLYQALKTIRLKRRAILVEGYFDCLQLHQVGFEETIALCGTAFSEYQSHLLEQLGVTVYSLLDGDAAGEKAADAFEIIAKSRKLKHKIVKLPDTTDPDTFVRAKGPKELENLLQC